MAKKQKGADSVAAGSKANSSSVGSPVSSAGDDASSAVEDRVATPVVVPAKSTKRTELFQTATQSDIADAAPDAADEEKAAASGDEDGSEPKEEEKPIKLYKSTRFKGYLTMAVSSIINYVSAQQSSDVISPSAVPSTDQQRRYAVAVASVGMVFSLGAMVMHLDRFTPLQRVWIKMFKPGSKIELCIAFFLIVWWSVAVGVETSIQGIAGDGKQQYSLYYSVWAGCLTSYWILERWGVAAGYSSLKSFITSWPYRAPGWILILFISIFTLIWYVDLWQNHDKLKNRAANAPVYKHFSSVPTGEWQWLVTCGTFTVFPSLIFVLVELFRETKADGTNQEKGRFENSIEGAVLLLLVLAWIPTVMIATTPGGAASLIGNAYFFTWMLVIFILETAVWFVHDLRKGLHLALKEKENEYHARQKEVLENTRAIQKRQAIKEGRMIDEFSERSQSMRSKDHRNRGSTEFFDAKHDISESEH